MKSAPWEVSNDMSHDTENQLCQNLWVLKYFPKSTSSGNISWSVSAAILEKKIFNLYLSSKSLVQFVKNIFNFEIFVIFLSLCEWYWLYIVLYRFEVKVSLILRGEREGHVLYFNIEHLVGWDIIRPCFIWLYIFVSIIEFLL